MLLYIMSVHLLIVYAVAFAIRDGTWTVCGAQMVSAGVDPALCSSFGAIEATSWSLGRALYRGELWRDDPRLSTTTTTTIIIIIIICLAPAQG